MVILERSCRRSSTGELEPRHCRSRVLSATLGDYAWLAVLNLLLFESALQEIIPSFSYIDEISTILLTLAAINVGAKGTRLGTLRLFVLGLVVIGVGLFGNLLFGVQQSIQAILIDLFTCVKYPIAAVASFVVLRNRDSLMDLVLLECKALLVVMSACAVFNLFMDIGMGSEVRYGIRSYSFVFPHYTFLSFGLAGMLLLLCQDLPKNRLWIALALILMCATLRSKSFGFVAIFLILVFSRRSKISPYLLVTMGGIVAVVLAWDQIVYYYTSDGFARNELTRAAFEVAHDYAPIGTGFATFGSNITSEPRFYSSLYYEYGLSNVYGLTPNDASFVSDTFWPTVLGQFGYVGLAAYVAMLVTLFLFQKKCLSGIAVAALCAYLLISSTSESAFFNPSAVFLAFCSGLAAAGFQNTTSKRSCEPHPKNDDWGFEK